MNCNHCGTEFDGKFCPSCGAPAAEENINVEQPSPQQAPFNSAPANTKKPFYKKWWFWVIIAIVIIGIIGGSAGGNGDNTQTTSDSTSSTVESESKVTLVDFSSMSKSDIENWASANNIKINFSEEYSDTVASGAVISQSKGANESVKVGTTVKVVMSKGKKPSAEYQNALRKAESYSKTLHMSKQGIYDQLISEYGEKFPPDAAQYAIDNMTADWNQNALEKAKSYQRTMSMSKSAIYDQLISEYGEKFTKEEAQYAIDHLDD